MLPLTKSYHIIIILSIAAWAVVPSFYLGSTAPTTAGVFDPSSYNIQNTGGFILDALKTMAGAIKKMFGGALTEWTQMIDWILRLWNKYARSWLEGLWHKFLGFLGGKVEEQKPIIEQELEKERQELTQEAKNQAQEAGQSVWERLRELIKENL